LTDTVIISKENKATQINYCIPLSYYPFFGHARACMCV